MAKGETSRRERVRFQQAGTGLATILWAIVVGVAVPAQAVTLRYQPEPGAVMAYTLRVTSETRTVGPGNRLTVTGAEGRLKGAVTVAPPDKPDEVALICRITGGRRSVSVRGAVQRHRVPAASERATMTARGETIEWDLTGGDLAELEPPLGVMLEPADLCAFEGYGAFPERDLQPGDTWSGHYDEKPDEPDQEAQRVRYRSTLLNVGRFRGRPCARIATGYELAALPEEPPAESRQESLVVRMTGDVLWCLDLERGMILYYVETMSTSAALALPQEERTFTTSIRSRLRLIGQMTAYDGSPLGEFALQP